jgi:hypothetical protein
MAAVVKRCAAREPIHTKHMLCRDERRYTSLAPKPVGGNPGGGKEIAMSPTRRTWAAFAIGVLALTAVPKVFATIQPSGVARADVCVNAGRRGN